MSECIRGSYDDLLYKLTYTSLYYKNFTALERPRYLYLVGMSIKTGTTIFSLPLQPSRVCGHSTFQSMPSPLFASLEF